MTAREPAARHDRLHRLPPAGIGCDAGLAMFPLSRRAGVVAALGSVQILGWGSTYYLPAILAAPMATELEVSGDAVYGAFSAALVVTALLGPAAGRRIDLFGGRGVLTLSSLLFAAGLALLGTAQDLVLLVAGWLVIGVGMALGLYEAAFSTLAALYGSHARGAITGVTLLGGLASTVCWPISAWLEADFGWRTACFVWAAAHLAIGLPLNRLLVPQGIRPVPPTSDTPAPPSTEGGGRAMILLAVVFAIGWFISTAMAAHLPELLQMTGASPAAAIAAAALVGPAQVAARLLEFGVLQRFHPLLSARLAAIAHPLGAALLLTIGAPAAALFAVFHGAGNGILTIAKGTLPLVIFGPGGYGRRQGVLMVPARFAQAAAPLVFALLLERMGASALLVSAGLALVALAALLALTPATMAEPG